MTAASTSDVLIIGGGVAGLSAAVALAESGARVTVLERKPYVGGRAYSYPHPALDEVIDSQHVLVGCCTNLIDLCQRSGADQHLRWYNTIPFLHIEQGTGRVRRSDLGTSSVPAPAHAALGFLKASMLSVSDKVAVATSLLKFLRGYPAHDDEPFSAWIKRERASQQAIRNFWEPLVVATLNDSFDRCSTKYAGQVFHEIFLKSSAGGRQAIPTQPLSVFYAAFAELAERHGATFQLRCSVDRIEQLPNGIWQATDSEGNQHSAARLLLATPFEQTQRLLQTLPEDAPQRARILPMFSHFAHAPITTVHLWYDREVTDLPQAALLGTGIQWMFNKTRIRGGASAESQPSYLELVIAASFKELHRTREDILEQAIREIALFLPRTRDSKIIKAGILKEARATFSVLPGLDQYRPAQDAPGGNLYLAGDWTRTNWPSTMEGAARSGRLAAGAIAGKSFMVPELPPSGLMRLIC
ncbi:FAD-dependent oxidoreductase [Granulicella sp. 5B5]|uniref:hydroxysqualene dehydroxylase HpnE n=1 Tax=Granulicella sp. 5B5 TaxID=1617967 RepID=UPI0015F6409A|nr:hydroxysqualene dehydroxylase HpnE [Granulicella sp. 5B5]QMV20095.1 FAD-dependent oxidoreductase [Granulicella sp. 5B5]